MICKDPAITYLNGLGYCPIRTPDESIAPLTVLAGDKNKLENFGLIKKFVRDGAAALPPLQLNLTTVDLQRVTTNKLESKLGIDLLKGFLEKLKMGGGGVHLKISPSYKVCFHFQECFKDRVFPADLITYLSQTEPTEVVALQEYFDKQGEAYVIYETIKSNSFSVSFYDEADSAVNVDGLKIEEIINADAGVTVKKDSETTLNFAGEKRLPFGFRALTFWLSRENDKMIFKTKMAGDVIMKMRQEEPVFENILIEISSPT